MSRCSICHSLLAERDEATTCPHCGQDYHQGCWVEIGGCATYGCASAAVAQKPAPPARVATGWGDAKTCPACDRSLSSSLMRCPCGAAFPWADPMSREDYQGWRDREHRIGSARGLLLFLFFATLIGFVAPATGLLAGLYAHARRELLAGAHGTYLALGYGSAALGAVWALVMVLLAVGR